MENAKFYFCDECNNLVALILEGKGDLVCCGKEMVLLKANTTDASKEKHVPVVKRESGRLVVKIGSVPHPMTSDHYIQWIAIHSEEDLRISRLHPGDTPGKEYNIYSEDESVEYVNFSKEEEEVPNCEGNPCNFSTTEIIQKPVTVYAYCNLHGLWKTMV